MKKLSTDKGEYNMNTEKNAIGIVSQAFYGNRVGTEVKKENIDSFILGYQSNDIPVTEPIDRTIINVPNTDNVVIVYNKHEEENELKRKEKLLKNENHIMKPLAVIPEENIEIYSRCIVCRINENGELESLREGDYEKFVKYLAE